MNIKELKKLDYVQWISFVVQIALFVALVKTKDYKYSALQLSLLSLFISYNKKYRHIHLLLIFILSAFYIFSGQPLLIYTATIILWIIGIYFSVKQLKNKE